MKDNAFKTTVAAPLYLIESFEPCWKCHSEQRVIALASRRLRTDDFDELDADDTAEPFLLTNITKMPQQISEHLSTAFPPISGATLED